jgi:L-arabinonolactonase
MKSMKGDPKNVRQAPEIKCVVSSRDSLGEGCLWDPATHSVWWLDIARPTRIHRFTPTTGEHKTWTSQILLTAMAKKNIGGFIVGGEDGVYCFDPASGAVTPYCKPETNVPQNRMNDGACDPQGRFWIGSMMQNIGPKGEDVNITDDTGNLFCVEPDGASRKMEQRIGVSNGPCWSPDGKIFYFSDSKNQVIYAYDFDGEAGRISNRRVLNDTKAFGYPDGATVDEEGHIWSARWEGSCVLRIDPKGHITAIIEVPATRVTCPVFGGPDLDTLYLTTSRAHVAPDVLAKFHDQGGLFAFKPGVKGLLKNAFAG